ncbi:MAG TPA: RluA family pseudouridine synthase [bacterium]|nr:RluA family pseudouridine synthase [bacterium]
MPTFQTIVLSENDANQTLEKFLKKLLPNAALGLIYSLVRKKRVRVDGKPAPDKKLRLEPGMTVDIALPDTDYAELRRTEPKKLSTRSDARLDKRWIVYEDGGMLVVNKPAGIAVHPGDHKSTEASLIELVQDYCAEAKRSSLTFRPSLAHRIDRETSGIVVIAKTKPVLDKLTKAFRDRTMSKKYLAVTVAAPNPAAGTIDERLSRSDSASGAKMHADEDGQIARTRYRTIATDIQGRYALVECKPETGRMHQIRAHLASIGCPILGDTRYGRVSENGYAKRQFGISRHMLHAAELSFLHPTKNIPVTYRARMWDDMQRLVDVPATLSA